MARPMKNNCDYFPHFTTMRNHKKVKALRAKFGQVLGYAFWSMFVEYLTEQDGIELENSDLEIEMFAGELGVSATEIRDMVDYCIKIELLFLTKDNFIYSESLNELLQPVFEKRKRAKELSKTRKRHNNGSYCDNDTTACGVSVTEMPQSKENKSKENKSKEEIIKEETETKKPLNDEIGILEMKSYADLSEYTKSDEGWIEAICMNFKIKKETVLNELKHFPIAQKALGRENTNLKDFKNHFSNYLAKKANELRTAENNKANSENTEVKKMMQYKADYMANVNGGKK
jgi:hypothetical protein